ncbi:lipoate--protein ligase [Gallibacterium genomosp. 3]|uniref:Octanoyltransferase n=1 Tax=Gallibacterium genomosp. 3 TaxID=505345 RepID=A0A1A7PSU4_9PAST|nr:lipoyl(octanoyl) transferase LipB [Gallibacterium genomosp. 3]OBX04225.1 lipoate--protein ligase [Gallibacterium genomosp. 3]
MGSTTEHLEQQVIIRQLGVQPYDTIWQRMQEFTDQRTAETIDEIWLVQHPPVFTQGQAGKAEHILTKTDIPIVQSDRGGQVTYHGPGQQVMYILVDIKRRKLIDKLSGNESPLSVRDLVTDLEQCVVKTLADYGIEGYPKPDAPGVYIDSKKICSLGLRIRKGCSFHGLAFNIHMDLSPFHTINPCGYAGLEMCQLQDFIDTEITCADVAPKLIKHFTDLIGYQQLSYVDGFPDNK